MIGGVVPYIPLSIRRHSNDKSLIRITKQWAYENNAFMVRKYVRILELKITNREEKWNKLNRGKTSNYYSLK